ncbi:hypothetical protein LCGC14_1523010 [marine sediment metagenome]|uniref:Uncharacterized protein n=1 Tax=marine sediment metagenome TaxID=412755 RepID=A0A0F9LDN8_9ZZZZ
MSQRFRTLATALFLFCLVLPIAKCSVGESVGSIFIDESMLAEQAKETSGAENAISEEELKKAKDVEVYLYVFDLVGVGAVILPLAFCWPALLFILRRFQKSGFILLAEIFLSGLTTWVLWLFASGFDVLIGWYVGALAMGIMWLAIVLDVIGWFKARKETS